MAKDETRAAKRMQQLRDEVRKHDRLYYEEAAPVISDREYDRLYKELVDLETRFPDLVTVEFVALAPDRSSLALYSRARYGRSDFGVNRRRVLRWLSRLQQIAGALETAGPPRIRSAY